MLQKNDIEKLMAELEIWLKSQSQLPQLIEKTVLKRFIYSMYGDLDGIKQLIEINYKMRNKHAHIFLDRDPMDANSQQLLQLADLIPLPGLTPQNNKLLIYRLLDHNADKFNFTDSIKVFFMVADTRFSYEDEAGIADGEVPIFDMHGYSLRHLTKISLSALRIYMKFVQEAHPVRLKQIHVLNCPPFMDKVLSIIKPFIRSEVFKLIRFHLPDSQTPYEYFPRDMLPAEYGGKAGSLTDLKQQWMGKLKERRDYLMDQRYWRMNKCKTTMDLKASSIDAPIDLKSEKNLSSSFKSLEID